MPKMSTPSRRDRTELLAIAAPAELIELADRCLEEAPQPTVVGPQVGLVPVCVREPVAGERFLLADVLATQAEVVHRGCRGWAMRLGDEPEASLAAAICDAEADALGPWAAAVGELLVATARRRAQADAAEWAELAPTEVHFEELA